MSTTPVTSPPLRKLLRILCICCELTLSMVTFQGVREFFLHFERQGCYNEYALVHLKQALQLVEVHGLVGCLAPMIGIFSLLIPGK